MHGDGLVRRDVLWPVVLDDDRFEVQCVAVVGRRFWCPRCRGTTRVWPAGLRRGSAYSAAVVLALLRVVASRPLGQGLRDDDAHALARRRPLPISERARSGHPRWTSLRRWLRALDRLWPSVALPATHHLPRLAALLATFGVGARLVEVLDAAVRAHARGGVAM